MTNRLLSRRQMVVDVLHPNRFEFKATAEPTLSRFYTNITKRIRVFFDGRTDSKKIP
jgi:ribosomal protein S24E